MPRIEVEIVGDASSLSRTYRSAERDTKRFGQSIERAGKGAIVASVGFRGLGRAVSYASASFIGGAGLAYAIESTVKAAEESQRVLGQTQNAVEKSGLSWARYGQRIRDASLATSKLSGFDDERLLSTFSSLVRRTGDVNRALTLNAVAANVARGRNISLEAASQLVLKASLGQIGALRRLGIDIGKHATRLQAVDLLSRKYAGSAEAYGRTAAGAQDRFKVAIENLQEAVGTDLLPTITKYLNKGADWLNQSKNQQRIVKDVHEAVKILSGAVETAVSVFEGFSGAVGGAKNAVKLLAGAFLALKFWPVIVGLTNIGGAAGGAEGKVTDLRKSLLLLSRMGPITIALLVSYEIGKKLRDAGLRMPGTAPVGKDKTYVDNGIVYGPDPNHPDVYVPMGPAKVAAGQGMFGLSGLVGSAASGLTATARGAARAAKLPPATTDTGAGGRGVNITATQRNTFFDARINRMLDRVQDIPTLKGQIARLKEISRLVQQRLNVTKDITRKFTLEDQLAQIARTVRGDQATLADEAKQRAKAAADAAKAARQAMIDAKMGWLDFAEERAAVTKTIRDDVRVQQRKIKWLEGRIKTEGRTLELVRGIWEARQKIKDLKKKNADVDPLAGLMQVSSKRLAATLAAGTGLGASGRAILGANIAGAEIQPTYIHNHLYIDGREVHSSVVRHDARSSRRTGNQTSGRRG